MLNIMKGKGGAKMTKDVVWTFIIQMMMSLETKKYQQALEFYSRLLGDATYNNAAIVGLANTYYEMARDTADSRDFTTI